MGLFDEFLNNVEPLAEKFGMPADQLQSIVSTLTAKLGSGGGDAASAVAATAEEHGISADTVQQMMAHIGAEGGVAGLGNLGGIKDILDKDGDGNPLNDLGGIAKGLFS